MISSEPKDVLVGAKLGQTEALQVELDARKAGQSKSQWVRQRLLDPTYDASIKQEHIFPIICENAREKYDGKKAMFQAQCGDRYFDLVGNLVVHTINGRTTLDLMHRGPPISEDSYPMPKGVIIHLSQEWVDSITPASVSPWGEKVHFQIHKSFHFRHCFSKISHR